jgi:chromosome partitioning protein
MPIIVFASSKGGAGKSTAAVILATELAIRDTKVTIIDADPNKPLSRWAKLEGKPKNLTVIGDVSEDTIIDIIDDAANSAKFVIVDLEGTASMMVGYALSRAELMIIPTQGSPMDATEAIKAINLIQKHEKAHRVKIPYSVLLTRTSAALNPRTLKSIVQEFQENHIPIMRTQMHERDAFKAIFSFGGGLRELDPSQVRNIEAAKENAEAFAMEAVLLLKDSLETRKRKRAA